MKTAHKQNLFAAALVGFCALASSTTQAQDKPAFGGSLTLAPNDATSPGGAGGGNDAASQEALAKAAQNPISFSGTRENGVNLIFSGALITATFKF